MFKVKIWKCADSAKPRSGRDPLPSQRIHIPSQLSYGYIFKTQTETYACILKSCLELGPLTKNHPGLRGLGPLVQKL